MSEYQYYEFRALERPLDHATMAKLRGITSRAEITPTSLVNEYHWGDFKGNVKKLMEEHFDAHLYLANWGTHQLMLRFPAKLLPLSVVEPYTTGNGTRAWATETHTLIDFLSHAEDDYEWTEGTGQLGPLLRVRDELLAGDLRALYIGWLAALDSDGGVDEDTVEPPVPPGLRKLTAAQLDLMTYLRVDGDLFEVAAAHSGADAPAGPSTAQLATWVAGLPDGEKNAALVRLLEGEGATVATDLLSRFRAAARATLPGAGAAAPRRTVGELQEARKALAEKNRRLEAERKAKEAAQAARERAAARERHLDALAGKETGLWREVETAVGSKLPKQYDHAVQLLTDLRDLAVRAGTEAEFARRIGALREQHRKKPSLQERLDKAGMPN